MIYPKDVSSSVNRATKLGGSDKVRAMILLFLIINGAIFMLVAPFTAGMGIPNWLLLLIQLFLSGLIGVYLWRVMVFNEDEKLIEMEDRSTDSFSRMFFLRNIDAGDVVKVGQIQVPVFEYDNGSVKFMLRLRFGETNESRARNTRKVLEQIYQIIGRHRMEFKETITKEDFSSSPEANYHRRKISNIKDQPKLSKTMTEVTRAVFDLSDRFSNVDMITITVKTKSSFQKYDLPSVISEITAVLRENITSFRSYDFLYKMTVLEYYKEFYGLNAIDLTLMKIKVGIKRLDTSRSSVRLYQIIGEDGKIWLQEKTQDQILFGDMKTAKKLDL